MGLKKIDDLLAIVDKLESSITSSFSSDQCKLLLDEMRAKLNGLNFTANTENNTKSAKNKGDVFYLPLPADFINEGGQFAIFADGASRGNPGPGAYATFAQLTNETIIFDLNDFATNVTNNQMELLAVIQALKELLKYIQNINNKINDKIFVYTDSRYVVDGANSWMPAWKKRNWKKADNKPPENLQMWQELDQLLTNFNTIKFIWIKGHNDHPQNERCDKICNKILDQIL